MLTQICIIKESVLCSDVITLKEVMRLMKGIIPSIELISALQLTPLTATVL